MPTLPLYSDPFGIVTGSGPDDYDSFANEDPAILGREFEMEDLLAYISDNNIENVVSISSDVHFAAHVSMSPDRAEGNFTNFKPLEEFVIGPIHGGAFGPNYMDTSFGAEYEFGEWWMCHRVGYITSWLLWYVTDNYIDVVVNI